MVLGMIMDLTLRWTPSIFSGLGYMAGASVPTFMFALSGSGGSSSSLIQNIKTAHTATLLFSIPGAVLGYVASYSLINLAGLILKKLPQVFPFVPQIQFTPLYPFFSPWPLLVGMIVTHLFMSYLAFDISTPTKR